MASEAAREAEDEGVDGQQQQSLPQPPELFTDDLILFFEYIMDKLEKVTSYSTNVNARIEQSKHRSLGST